MSQMQDYDSILQEGWAELPEDPLLPDGSYRFKCLGAPKVMPPRSADQSATVMFPLVAIEAMDDVDDAALDALRADNIDIGDITVFHKIWLKKPSDWRRMEALIEKLGVNPLDYPKENGGKAASLKACKGQEVIGYVTTRVFTDKQSGEPRQENDIKSFTAVT